MGFKFIFAIFAIAVPLVSGYGSNSYDLPSASYGLQELANAASGSQQGGASITANAEVQPSPAEDARLSHAQNQLQNLNLNPTYHNLQNSDAIAESLAESNLASNIRQGNVNVVAPNVVQQGVFRSLFVPSGKNSHQILATPPLAPIVVTQPGAPPQHVSSGPAAIVRAAPVIYKVKPSVIYQQEVINKVPTPLSLNPVYVKVYKPGKKIDAPVAPVVQPVYNHASYAPSYGSSAAAADSYANAPHYGGHGQYSAPDSYAPSHNYGPSHSYAPAHNYGPSSYAPASYPQAGY